MSKKKIDDKNIVFVAQYLSKGGAERVMSVLIYELSKRYDITLILLYEGIVDYCLPDKVKIVKLRWKRGVNLITRIRNATELRPYLKNKIVISFLYSAIRDTVLASLFLNRYLIVSERNDPRNDPPGRLRQFVRTFSYLFADKVVFQTHNARDYFPKSIQRKGIIIANPIKNNLPRAELNENRIVSVCRLTEQKNIPMAIRVFEKVHAKHNDYVYDIYGEGTLQSNIETLIREKNLERAVYLRGFSNNIHEDIRTSKIFISSSNYEGISNSMLEAMGMGIPVVCTDCPIGGAREVIKDGENGFLVSVGDYNRMAEIVNNLIDDKEMLNNVSNKAISVNQRYSSEEIAKQWISILMEINHADK